MLWAPRPEGPWSEPVMVLNSTRWNSDFWRKYNRTAKCDSNLNGILLDNKNSNNNDRSNAFLLGLWRRCETPDLLTVPHYLTATDWKDPTTYRPQHVDSPLVMLAGSGAEDPSNIWITTTSDMKPGQVAFHAIFHDEQATRCMLGQCGGSGRHAVSLSTTQGTCTGSWRYATVNAYDRYVSFTNGTTLRSDTRARPHVIMDPTNPQHPLALSTGLKERDESGYVWTLVAPLGGHRRAISNNDDTSQAY
mmetsp:Transcript_7669/g.14202  ORF Transcript_7669/g.14202 Transcript_7669/m.14202 type:complete len:248 (+) Transcript_7669:2-745(+)